MKQKTKFILQTLAAMTGNILFFALVMAWLLLINDLINH